MNLLVIPRHFPALIFGFLAVLFFAMPKQCNAALAFPGAEGFGANATGGRNGMVFHVTNLADSGTGSFRDGVSVSGRLIVFDVGGYIILKSEVSVASNITIAGQTAPGDGIALYGQAVSFSGSSNIVVRYLRFREGITGGSGKSSVMMDSCNNIILDHCSIEWGRWDCFDMNTSTNITVQYCIIGEGINPQSFGLLCQSDNVTISHNLFLCNEQRSPKAKGTIQYIDNVIYNWGSCGLVGGHSGANHYLDIINNTFIAGPTSNASFVGQFTSTDNVYESGNYTDMDKDGTMNGRAVVPDDFTDAKGSPTFVDAPQFSPTIPVTVQSAAAAYEIVIAEAGASLHRDSVDNRLIGFVVSLGTLGGVITDPASVGGPGTLASGTPPLDTDQDGIPDSWESARGLNPNDATDAALDRNGDGYSNLEEYFGWLVGDFPDLATAPTPATGSTGVSVVTALSWTPASGATSHDVYFGPTNPPALKGNQTTAIYNPGPLGVGTFFWRVDEKDTVTGSTTQGNVWNFQTGGSDPIVYQAEAGTYSSGSALETILEGWTGTGYVTTDKAIGAYIEWTVTVPALGSYTLDFRYLNDTPINRLANLRINGTVVQQAMAFSGTGEGTTWGDVVVTKTLQGGVNTIRLTALSSNGCASLDKLTIE